MKPLSALLSWICAGSLSLASQTSSPPATLTGIVDLPGFKFAFLSVPATRPGWPATEVRLREAERYQDVEVVDIFPERGAVELRQGGSNFVTALSGQATNTSLGVPAIALAGAGLKSALEIYAELSGRSLLRSPILPDRALTFQALAGDKAKTAKLLSDAFSTNGIAVIPDGDKFALVVRKEEVRFFHARSAEIKQPDQSPSAAESFVAGAVNFFGADLTTVARLYAELSGRKTDWTKWPRDIPRPNFFFKNQTALTKAEMLYALEKLFELHGLKMVPDGDQFMKPELFGRK